MAEIIIKVMATSRLKLTDKFTGGSRQGPTSDAGRIKHAVERAARDASFIDNSVGLLCDFGFPAFKHAIVDYAKQIGAPEDAVALFESLDWYIAYRDLYSLQKSLEENNSENKKDYQIADKIRTSQDVRTTPTNAGTSQRTQGFKQK